MFLHYYSYLDLHILVFKITKLPTTFINNVIIKLYLIANEVFKIFSSKLITCKYRRHKNSYLISTNTNSLGENKVILRKSVLKEGDFRWKWLWIEHTYPSTRDTELQVCGSRKEDNAFSLETNQRITVCAPHQPTYNKCWRNLIPFALEPCWMFHKAPRRQLINAII